MRIYPISRVLVEVAVALLHRRTANILVVENEPMMRSVLHRALSSQYRVFLADSLQEAKAVLERYSISFMLTAVHMPDGNGFDLISHLHEHHAEIPFAFLAALADDATMRRIEASGAPLFVKPLDLPELLACLEIVAPSE